MITILKTIKKFSENTNGYKLALMGGSAVCGMLYIYRYHKVSQVLPQKHSDDLKSLTIVLTGLCLWNFLIAGFTENILLNLDNTIRYLDGNKKLPKDFRGYFINEDVHSVLNMYYLQKDVKILSVTVVSMALFHIFSNVIMKSVEYISFISDKSSSDVEKTVEPLSFSKSVSFDDDLTTYQYLDMELSVSKSRLSVGHSSLRTFFVKHCISFAILSVISYCIVPDIFLFNSSAILLQYSNITVKSDHIFYAIFTLFFVDVVTIFVKVANHPKFKNFPQFTSLLSRFIWCYGSLILAASMSLMILFNDVLINLVKLITIYTYTPTHTISYNVLFITLIFINYLTHTIQLSCTASADCSQLDLVNALSENFIWLNDTLSSCCIVLDLSCLVILPLLIWIVVIESKLGRSIY